MPNVLGTPDDEDESVGAVLARMRRSKRITGAKLAAIVGMSQPKISRIERGKGLPDPEDVGVLARALGADESDAQALMARAERLSDRMTDWRPTSVGLADRQKTLADWESAAKVVRAFEPALVLGLLQTDGYARLVLQAFQRLTPAAADSPTEASLLAAVSARVSRRQVLADQSKSFNIILSEAVLKRRTYPPLEMLNQIHRIREIAAEHDNVRIVMLPDDAPVGVPLMHGFSLYDDTLVVVDLFNTGLISRSRRDVESYRQVFDILDEQTVDIGPILDRYESSYIEMLQKPGK
ncbi:helix-turn-helix transcriptional regulator [Actinoplanes sp. NPDC026619]|uniref:helix-turn-helix domain-containing protein n=1 Tax=Actinoplanes sp. NPDC026619 TaxID=3155798 RepID=UPI0033E2EF20